MYCSHYYYLHMCFRDKIFINSEETVCTAHISTTYSSVFLKIFLVTLKRQYIVLTLLICRVEFI